MQSHLEENEKDIDEAKQLANMLIRSVGGQDALKWVDVLGREILERLKDGEDES